VRVADRAKSPPRAEIVAVLNAVLEGGMSREDASDWAQPWITESRGPVRVEDEAAWRALTLLGSIDLPTTDRPYLYERVDIEGWRDDLRATP
jgi:hypothetical protein